MKKYIFIEIATGNLLTLKREDMTIGQIQECRRDGFELIAIR